MRDFDPVSLLLLCLILAPVLFYWLGIQSAQFLYFVMKELFILLFTVILG